MVNTKPIICLTAKESLVIIASFQLALFGLIALNKLNLGIPLIRQVIAFIDLTFIPGFLLLRILRIRNLDNSEDILYSVGLSLFSVMAIGFFINLVYSSLGILKPLSEIPLVITLSTIILLLCFICYLKNSCVSGSKYFVMYEGPILGPAVFSLFLLPLLAVLGAYLLRDYNSNKLALFFIIALSSLSYWFLRSKKLSNLYPLAIYIFAISLLLHFSIMSRYIGGDAYTEFLCSNLVKINGFWDISFQEAPNTLLSIVMLQPILSILCNVEMTWVFKVMYPILYALTPVALYKAYEKYTSNKIAFLAALLLIFYFSFYTAYVYSLRTGFAELFLSLLILLIIDKRINHFKKKILLIVFATCLVTSHYASAYFLMDSLIVSLLLSFLTNKSFVSDKENSIVTASFILLFIVINLAWYMYVTSSYMFSSLVRFASSSIQSISQWFDPESSYFSRALIETFSPSIMTLKVCLIIVFLGIFVYVAYLSLDLLRRRGILFTKDYALLSVSSFLILIAILFPARGFSIERGIHLLLCFVAPFSMMGFIRLGKVMKRTILKTHLVPSQEKFLRGFCSFLILILLLGSGFVAEVVTRGADFAPNTLISKERYGTLSQNPQFFLTYNRYHRYEQDVFAAMLLSTYGDNKSKIYLLNDFDRTIVISYGMKPSLDCILVTDFQSFCEEVYISGHEQMGYIYLGKATLEKLVAVMFGKAEKPTLYNISKLYHCVNHESNKIYSNGGSEIYYH